MIKKFNEYVINEYNGPGQAAGFRYSDPTDEFAVQVVISLLKDSKSKFTIEDLKEEILKISEKIEVDISGLESELIDEDSNSYTLQFTLISYSRDEVDSIMKEIKRELSKRHAFKFNIKDITIL